MAILEITEKETLASQKKKYTYEEYMDLPDNPLAELIEGDLQMVASPIPLHQKILRELGYFLLRYVKEKKNGEIFYAPCDIVLGKDNVLQPDIFFIAQDRLSIIGEKNIQGAPDIVVEILSQSSAYQDLVLKKRLYAQFGVKEYWIIDPMEKTLDVLVAKNKKFELFQQFTVEETMHSFMLADFCVALKDIF